MEELEVVGALAGDDPMQAIGDRVADYWARQEQKILAYIGLSSAQATTCQTLSNWDAFVAAGWSTGYET